MLFLLLFANVALAEDVRVVVMDTGLDITDSRFVPYLCRDGHRDFTGEGLRDFNGHGTHVAGTIVQYAGSRGYCLVIYKFFAWQHSVKFYLDALSTIVDTKPPFVNLSAGGARAELAERISIKMAKDTTFVVAAGNENEDITVVPYYPASYPFPNIIAVGSIKENGLKTDTSNYGSLVKAWEVGENVSSTCRDGSYCKMTGTSMAAAIHTGKLVRQYVETH